MKYADRDALVADLREMADLIERVGIELPIESLWNFRVSQYFYGSEHAREKMVRAAKALGKANKNYSGEYFNIERKMKNGTLSLYFECKRDVVCERKVVGTKTEPKKVWVEIPNETVEKEIVEWECTEPLLAADS